MFFESIPAVRAALCVPESQAAGEALKKMTVARMTLLIADHKEATLENIRKYQPGKHNDDRTERPKTS